MSPLADRAKLIASRSWALIWNALGRLGPHRATQLAASMSYYALFSVFPAAIVLASAAGFVLDDPAARQQVVDFLFKELPLSDDSQGRSDIASLVKGVATNSGTLGLVGGVALLISASALISAARNSLNVIFGGDVRRGLLRGKALDVALVLGFGLLLALSFAATLLTQLDPDLGGSLGAIEAILTVSGWALPLALSAAVFAALYVVLPVEYPPLRDVWPGVLFAAVGFELLKRGFSIYIDNFANYSAVYGSLGAVIAFMFFTYVASLVFLIGAEVAALWPRVRAGDYDAGPRDGDASDKPFVERLRDFGRGLVSRNRTDEHETT